MIMCANISFLCLHQIRKRDETQHGMGSAREVVVLWSWHLQTSKKPQMIYVGRFLYNNKYLPNLSSYFLLDKYTFLSKICQQIGHRIKGYLYRQDTIFKLFHWIFKTKRCRNNHFSTYHTIYLCIF